MIELAADAIGALSRFEEGFAVFLLRILLLSWFLLTMAMCELALFSVATESDFDPVFAELSFVLGLELVRLDILRLARRLF